MDVFAVYLYVFVGIVCARDTGVAGIRIEYVSHCVLTLYLMGIPT